MFVKAEGNMYVVTDLEGDRWLQSYDTLIGFWSKTTDVYVLDKDLYNCTKTTTKHVKKFCPYLQDKKSLEAAKLSGRVLLTDLQKLLDEVGGK